MIFVIIGILTLIVSFFVALISLIREQKNVEEIISSNIDEVEEEPVVKRVQDVHSFKHDDASLVPSQPIASKQDEKVVDQVVDEPFPWESKSADSLNQVQNVEGDEIAQIEAQLNKIKVEKSQKISQIENDVEELEVEENQEKQSKQTGRLSGVFSIKDLIDSKF